MVQIEDLAAAPTPQFPTLMFGAGAQPAGRTFLIGPDESDLLQVQGSQVVFNWRRRDDRYPHLEYIADRFVEGYKAYTSMLDSLDLAVPAPRQFELSYFNWMPATDAASAYKPAAPPGGLSTSLLPENYASQTSFIDEREGRRVARLRVDFAPAFRAVVIDGDQSLVAGHTLVLTYRAPIPVGQPWTEAVEELAAQGRDVIVRSFTTLTTDEAHDRWGRTQ